MTITLDKVIPVFLEKEKVERSEIWNKTISFYKGEQVQIIAPSGSGKTSLMHFLYGMRKDYDGLISFNQKPINAFSITQFAEYRSRQISIIFQDLRLFPEQTAFENINIKRILVPYHDKKKISEMAARLGIEKKMNKPANTCSYGEQQRIAIIRSLMQPFDFLLMDEPFSHLDENNRKIAMDLINEEAELRNASIIMADLKRVEQFSADKIFNL